MPIFEGYFRRFSWPIALAMLALMAIGITAIWTVERAVDSRDVAGCTAKQAAFAVVGLGAFLGATVVNYRRVGQGSYALFALTLFLLVAVLFCPARKGAHRWIQLGGPVQLQPSELAKLVFIVALAWYLRYRDSYRRLGGPWA
jgi:cell division protein FtsW (lipid II flippase)